MDKQITQFESHQLVQGKAYSHALRPSGNLMSSREFLAIAAGRTLESIKGMKGKDLKAEIIAEKGETEGKALIKKAYTEFDGIRDNFHTAGKQIAALCSADPRLRAVSVPVFGQGEKNKGQVLGVNTKFRIVKQQGSAKKIADLEAEIAQLRAALPAPAAA